MSIRRKLMALTMLTSGTVLLLVTLAFVINETVTYRNAIRQEMTALAKIIGLETTAAITFNDPKAAQSTLETLSSNAHIISAAILTPAGTVFASYQSAKAPASSLQAPDPGQTHPGTGAGTGQARTATRWWSKWEHGFEVRVPIMLDNQPIGTMQIRSDWTELFSRLKWFLVMVFFISIGTLAVGWLLAARLLRPISAPILDLAGTVETVSIQKDYSLRATEHGIDEIGQLIKGFNDMLCQVQARDEQLQRTARELKQSNSELQDFLSISSHHLQEPLRKIIAFSGLLQSKQEEGDEEQRADYLRRLQKAVNRMRELIEDLQAYSRVSTKAQPFARVDLDFLARRAVANLGSRIQQVQGRVEMEALPSIEADPFQIGLLLTNLIGNGIKFHRKEEPPVVRISAVTVASDRADDEEAPTWCELTVEDNGVGFDPKYADRIFGVFQRLYGRDEYEGTGIGLSICKKIVDRHRGTISVRSTPGAGSAFVVTLPVQQHKEEGEGAPLEDHKGATAAAATS